MNKEELIKALEYTKKKHQDDVVDTFDTNISMMCTDVLKVLKNCIEIPEDVTNGYMVKAMFPDARVSEIIQISNCDEIYYVTIEKVAGITNEMRVTKSWWDAPFNIERSETRQGLSHADQETMMPAT